MAELVSREPFDVAKTRLFANRYTGEPVRRRLHEACDKIERLEEQFDAVGEKVARALYEKAMEERRACLPNFTNDTLWDDAPYVPPLAEGQGRPVNWRDPWREQAAYFLSDSYPASEPKEDE